MSNIQFKDRDNNIQIYTKLTSIPLEHKVQTGHLTYKFHRQKYCKFAQSSEIARFEWGQTYYIKLKLRKRKSIIDK